MQFNLNKLTGYQSVKTIDMHTEGEPLRIILAGYPEIIGDTILAKRQYVTQHLDHLRKFLMYEPRGHADMYGALITTPCTPNADFGILFMHNEGYSSMCGHGILAVASLAVETQAIELNKNKGYIGIDTPAGLIKAYVKEHEKTTQISFDNVPAFVEVTNQTIFVEGIGNVSFDIAYGGAYYVFVDADKISVSCTPENQLQLINLGRTIKNLVAKQYQVKHPVEQDLSFIYGTIFYSNKTTDAKSHSRHVCIFADGEVDRSPTGTGVSARIALLNHQQLVELGTPITIESIVSSKMTVSATQSLDYHDIQAVIPRVSGRSYITGIHEFLLNQQDIFPQGFLLR
ncbi:proline racemase family protein [Thalassotalea sp. PP2-459]|uniref:proline racemase family protein n=1 Tax=Thalassotalea sp. PP2-459 TaxID=1742724 RepID=UPI0009431932|nr:proline racemase family protein [Thalassotalea sp. PP2-459]OKY25622.1 proline racemase [Thalassotalea sp. PP2-459]